MCGISGIIDRKNRPIDPALIERLSDLVIHRGPDDKGYYFGSNFAFGHRRLSILDLTEHGHQPMVYQNRYWITYNGEIYNYLELRTELESIGFMFQTRTDTEVILAAYTKWGVNCLHRFNGMWAFAIYDSVNEKLFIARDRFGVKPIYYMDTEDQFAFGSEIKQLLTLQLSVHANRRLVIESLLTSFDGHTTETLFEGIKSLPQSHYGIYDLKAHTFKIERYYELKIDPTVGRLSMEEATFRFRELLEDSVSIRLRSDVRVGTCLSGGLDSSAISGIASQLYNFAEFERFTAIHAKSIDAERDESRHARAVADHFGMDLHVVAPGIADFVTTIDELVYTQEEPFGSPSMFMGWHVFRKAKELNCKVMLNGQGGDEALLGYERYFVAYLKSLSLLRFLREMRAQARNSRLRLSDVFMYYFYFTNATLRIQRLKHRSLIRQGIKDGHDFTTVRKSADSFKNLDDLQIFEIATLQLPHLLRYEDRNSMRHSIETRLPFLDYRLVEFCISIRPELKIRDGWTKYVLRKAMEDKLPESITWRKDKFGFEAPERTWFNAYLSEMKKEISGSRILAEITNHKRLIDSFSSLSFTERWKYFNLAAWERVYGVQW
jgi:asparagine synthase (glutamine-hydrolysing)